MTVLISPVLRENNPLIILSPVGTDSADDEREVREALVLLAAAGLRTGSSGFSSGTGGSSYTLGAEEYSSAKGTSF